MSISTLIIYIVLSIQPIIKGVVLLENAEGKQSSSINTSEISPGRWVEVVDDSITMENEGGRILSILCFYENSIIIVEFPDFKISIEGLFSSDLNSGDYISTSSQICKSAKGEKLLIRVWNNENIEIDPIVFLKG